MANQRWFLMLPLSGAARVVASSMARSIEQLTFKDNCKLFDSKSYYEAFSRMLRNPDENMVVDLVCQSAIIACLDFEATHVFVPALTPITLFALNIMRKQGIKVVYWLFEDYRRISYWKEMISGSSYFCAIQESVVRETCQQNEVPFLYLPTAAAFVPNLIKFTKKEYDIVFVGIPSPYRIHVLELLHTLGYKIGIAGSGWDQYAGQLNNSIIIRKWLNESETIQFLSNGTIGINLSYHEPTDRIATHLSPRIFDCMAAGCIPLTEDIVLLLKTLPTCFYEKFNTVHEIPSLVNKILSNPTLYQDHLQSNFLNVKASQTYTHRATQLIEFVNNG